jgi:hypothetical protein
MRYFFRAKVFCVLQKNGFGKNFRLSGRGWPTIHEPTTCRWHPVATGAVRHIEVLKTAGGPESISTLSRPEWPSWPFSPSAWMQESPELLPAATAPRAARGRTNAREPVSCMGLATRGLAPGWCSPVQRCKALGELLTIGKYASSIFVTAGRKYKNRVRPCCVGFRRWAVPCLAVGGCVPLAPHPKTALLVRPQVPSKVSPGMVQVRPQGLPGAPL